MNNIKILARNLFLFMILFAIIFGFIDPEKKNMIKVLILSGKNNHEWEKTTPLLVKIYSESGLFRVKVSERPDTLTYNDLKEFRVVLSNWNNWPDTTLRMTKEWENDFLKYVNEGGSVLAIHAGACSFYSWDAFHRIGIGRWGKETSHGVPTKGHVYAFDQNHPVTKGMSDFYIIDEIWEKSEIYPGVRVLASVKAINEKDGHQVDEPAVFVNQTGKGRSFFTILGHDERALFNQGLQTLLLRAAQWCAGIEPTAEIPSELKMIKSPVKDQQTWNVTDTSVALNKNSEIIWQFNYNNRFGKTYFHPLSVNHSALTCVSPSDHPWHLGLWFSWKFINDVNYWEYMNDFKSEKTGYRSAGVTELQKIDILKKPDFSCDIRLKFNYHPIEGNSVMAEERNFHISSQFHDGSYYIDEEHLFNPLADSVILDRTPVTGEPGGQSWGGYAGVSIRFSQSLTSPEIISPADSINCKRCYWLYMGFRSLTGDKTGISIFENPRFTTSSTRWYVIQDTKIPFFYFSPAILFSNKMILKKGENLHLKYRIWILPGPITKEQLQEKFDQYINK